MRIAGGAGGKPSTSVDSELEGLISSTSTGEGRDDFSAPVSAGVGFTCPIRPEYLDRCDEPLPIRHGRGPGKIDARESRDPLGLYSRAITVSYRP